jgi:hypothetical protein
MENQLNYIQVSRHIKDIGQQPIHKEDASKIRDISQNDLERGKFLMADGLTSLLGK